MGQPVVSPWVIYFMNTVDALKGIFLLLGIVSAIVTLIFLALFLLENAEDDKKRLKRATMFLAAITFSFFFLFSVTPSKKTIIEILVAKHITYENMHKVTTELKKIEEAFLKYLEK